MKIKIMKFEVNSKMPEKQKEGDVGFDAYISSFKMILDTDSLIEIYKDEYILNPLERVGCSLGFATEIPNGYYAQVVPRSGLALWKGITILNTPGTIDAGYRNEWMAIVVNLSKKDVILKVGDRICQIIIRKMIDFEFEEVSNLGSSERGLGGFGSTGR